MNVNIIRLNERAIVPEYMSLGASGCDISACLGESIVLKPGSRAMITTGLAAEVPEGFEIQVRPRSGLAIKHGVTVLNAPGTIDSDYRGEIKVLLVNLGLEDFVIEHGMRVAQLICMRVERVNWSLTEKLSDTRRGQGGFGSTGIRQN